MASMSESISCIRVKNERRSLGWSRAYRRGVGGGCGQSYYNTNVGSNKTLYTRLPVFKFRMTSCASSRLWKLATGRDQKSGGSPGSSSSPFEFVRSIGKLVGWGQCQNGGSRLFLLGSIDRCVWCRSTAESFGIDGDHTTVVTRMAQRTSRAARWVCFFLTAMVEGGWLVGQLVS